MHEIGIASSILESVVDESRRRPGVQVRAVGVRIGELACVDKDALDFAFEALTRDTAWQSLKLQIECCPRRQKCLACYEEFAVHDLACPRCGANVSTRIGGTELYTSRFPLALATDSISGSTG
jgi:hydrogenase nickel incorporation protein HypA/HybF